MEVEGKLFLEAEQRAAVAQARLAVTEAQPRNASYHQACLLLAGQQAPRNARDAYHQALGFALVHQHLTHTAAASTAAARL